LRAHNCPLRVAASPDDWSELTQLELIRLDQNNLKGPLPTSWGSLRNLRVLTFWDNKLTGGIPDSWADVRVRERWLHASGAHTGTAHPDAIVWQLA
jgi:hypothetical protein